VSLLTLWTNCPSIEQALEGLLASCNWSDSAGLVDAANITMNESVVVALLVVNSAWTDDCFLVHFPVEKHKPNAVFFYSSCGYFLSGAGRHSVAFIWGAEWAMPAFIPWLILHPVVGVGLQLLHTNRINRQWFVGFVGRLESTWGQRLDFCSKLRSVSRSSRRRGEAKYFSTTWELNSQ